MRCFKQRNSRTWVAELCINEKTTSKLRRKRHHSICMVLVIFRQNFFVFAGCFAGAKYLGCYNGVYKLLCEDTTEHHGRKDEQQEWLLSKMSKMRNVIILEKFTFKNGRNWPQISIVLPVHSGIAVVVHIMSVKNFVDQEGINAKNIVSW